MPLDNAVPSLWVLSWVMSWICAEYCRERCVTWISIFFLYRNEDIYECNMRCFILHIVPQFPVLSEQWNIICETETNVAPSPLFAIVTEQVRLVLFVFQWDSVVF